MHYVLIDGNNIAFAAQAAGMDKKNSRLYAGELETTAINGVLRKLREIQNLFPDGKLLVLWDAGKNWRYSIYPDYKGNRKENPSLVEIKNALEPQRPLMEPILDSIGIPQISAPGYEADDIAAFMSDMMAKNGHRVTLVTRDQDWLQLVQPKVAWYDHWKERMVSWLTFEAEVGYKSPALFSESKIVKGDSGDNVSGIYGVGEAAAEAIILNFGSADTFVDQWDAWVDAGNCVTGHPLKRPFKRIVEFMKDKDAAREKMNLNRRLMDLRTMFGNKEILPVITRSPGKLNLDSLKSQLAKLAFISIVSDLERWVQPFHAQPK